MIIETQARTATIPLAVADVQDDHLEICRLLAAASVNSSFCCLLLEDPERAMQIGYHGESFFLTLDERNLILSIGADSLESLAWQIFQALGHHTHMTESLVAEAPVMIEL